VIPFLSLLTLPREIASNRNVKFIAHILSLIAFAVCGLGLSGCKTTDEVARTEAARARYEAEQARLEAERVRAEAARARARASAPRPAPKPEIFEPVRSTPSTIDDPLYGRE
jgi:hypothetical protein